MAFAGTASAYLLVILSIAKDPVDGVAELDPAIAGESLDERGHRVSGEASKLSPALRAPIRLHGVMDDRLLFRRDHLD